MITGNKEDEIKRVAGEIEQTDGVVSYAVHDISKEAGRNAFRSLSNLPQQVMHDKRWKCVRG